MKKIKTIAVLLISIIILSIEENVKAVVNVNGGWNTLGQNNACEATGNYIACYIPKFEFRVTLVDKEGKKVAGTKSVEYGYSTNGKTTKVNFSNEQKGRFVDNNKYGYRYSSEYNDYNSINDHSYYQVYMVNTPRNYQKYVQVNGKWEWRDDPSHYSEFINEFKTVINSRTGKYGIDSGTQGTYDFLTMFLYHCGYLNKNESGGVYYNIDDTTNEYIKRKYYELAGRDENGNVDSTKDYYMLIEPLYTIFYNEKKNGQLTYSYGTTQEIGNLLYQKASLDEEKINDGYLGGISLIFTYNAGANLYVNPNKEIDTFRTTKFKTLDINDLKRYNVQDPCGGRGCNKANTTDLCCRKNRIGKWGELANTEYGYGINILRLSAIVTVNEPEKQYMSATLDLCGKESTKEANDGIISFSAPFSLGLNTETGPLIFTYDETKLEKKSDANNNIYCYDNFKYDFSETLEKFDSNKTGYFRPLTQIDITPGKLTVNRYCYIEKWQNYETSFTENCTQIKIYH